MKKKLLLPVLAILSVLMLPALEFIEQLDESEVKQLHKKIKELDSYNDELIRDNNQLRNELDNQDVLSEEWIGGYEVEEEHKYYAFTKAHKWIDGEGNITYKYWKYYVLDGRVFLSNRFSTHNGYSTKMSKSEWNKLGVNDSNADFEEVTE